MGGMNTGLFVAASALAWMLTSFLKQRHWPTEVNSIIAMAASAGAAIGTLYFQSWYSDEPLPWHDLRTAVPVVFAGSTAVYTLLANRYPIFMQLDGFLTNLLSSKKAVGVQVNKPEDLARSLSEQQVTKGSG